MERSRPVVAIPALNEEKHIGRVVQACIASGAEVWVVDDGSIDRTAEMVRQAGGRVIQHPRNLGKGMAIRTALDAFARSDREFLIFLDADGQHDPAFLQSFVDRAAASSAGIVLGNRIDDARRMPFVRRCTNRFMSWLISRLAGQCMPDTQCGYRLVSRAFARQFRPTTSRFELESEMLIQAGRLGFRIESVPISTIYRGEKSHIHPLPDTLRFFRMIFRYVLPRKPQPPAP